LATRFAARGSQVLILIGPELLRTRFVDEVRRAGIPIREVGWSPRISLWKNLCAAFREFGSLDARLVHFNISWLWWMWTVPLAARVRTSAKVIGTMRAMPDPHQLVPRRRHFGFLPGLRLWHLEEVVAGFIWGRLLHRTIAINARDFPLRLVRDYWFPKDRIGVVYNGIDVTRPPRTSEERQRCRAALKVAQDEFLVCYAGRLSNEKGVHLLLEALAGLPDRVRAVIVGEGPQQPGLETLVAKLSLSRRVTFVGFDRDPEGWMASADVVAVPSTWYEAFGRVVIEAMAQGVAVVASRIGGMGELFEDGVHGRFVEAGSVAQLRQALEELAERPIECKRMGERARKLVVERYSLERVEADYTREYLSLVGSLA
jgi:glycosyltransferase involved in cell wall biosynthesis